MSAFDAKIDAKTAHRDHHVSETLGTHDRLMLHQHEKPQVCVFVNIEQIRHAQNVTNVTADNAKMASLAKMTHSRNHVSELVGSHDRYTQLKLEISRNDKTCHSGRLQHGCSHICSRHHCHK